MISRPSTSSDLERMIAGVRRLHGEAETRERRPITKDLRCSLISIAGPEKAQPYAPHFSAWASSRILPETGRRLIPAHGSSHVVR